MRKVKFTASTWYDKLTKILDDFPKVDNIHPFYADLLNVLYDKDHYKLALGQLSMARNIIGKLSQGAPPTTPPLLPSPLPSTSPVLPWHAGADSVCTASPAITSAQTMCACSSMATACTAASS